MGASESAVNGIKQLLPAIGMGAGQRSTYGLDNLEPFHDYYCMGDELQGSADGPYSKPFRFHVYRNMPPELLDDIVEEAKDWWGPDDGRNQYLTEIQIYKYLHLHPCHTDDPLLADAFVVPAQTVTAVTLSRYDGPNGEPAPKVEGVGYMCKVADWIKTQPSGRRFQGRDHYMVSVPWWTTGRFLGVINAIGVEAPAPFHSSGDFEDTLYLHGSNDIIVPYPDPDAMGDYTDEYLATVPKDLLVVFVGQSLGHVPLRQIVKEQFSAYNKRVGSEKAVWNELHNRGDLRDVTAQLPRAIFGPVMPGDSFSSRRLFTLIFAGTIPVIICDHFVLPFQDMLDYSKFAIFVPESTLRGSEGETTDNDLLQILEKVSPEEIASLQRNGKKVRKHFTYTEGKPQPGDAFDLLIREMAHTNYRNRAMKSVWQRAYGGEGSA